MKLFVCSDLIDCYHFAHMSLGITLTHHDATSWDALNICRHKLAPVEMNWLALPCQTEDKNVSRLHNTQKIDKKSFDSWH